MDWSAWVEAGAAAITAAFTGILAVATVRLWDSTKGLHDETKRLAALAESQSQDMKASIAVAQQAADASVAAQRPWLELEFSLKGDLFISPPYRYLHNYLGIDLNVTARNNGNTPARGIYVKSAIVFYDTKGRPFSPVDCYLGPHMKSADFGLPDYGGVIFPKGSLEKESFASCLFETMKSSVAGAMPSQILVLVVCSVSYAFDGGHGYTLGSASLKLPLDDLIGRVVGATEITPSMISFEQLELGEIEFYAN